MAEFKHKTEEELENELEEEIRTFLKEIDLLIRVSKRIPGQTINFDPFLYYLWKNGTNH